MAGQDFGHAIYTPRNVQQHSQMNSNFLGQRDSQQAQAGLSISTVKRETFGAENQTSQWEHLPYEPPSKRARLAEPVRANKAGHRFVSQNKWKFPESQPWLEVTPAASTKARNAAKISKTEGRLDGKDEHKPISPAPTATTQIARQDIRTEGVARDKSTSLRTADKAASNQDHPHVPQVQSFAGEPPFPLIVQSTQISSRPQDLLRDQLPAKRLIQRHANSTAFASPQDSVHQTQHHANSVALGRFEVIPKSKPASDESLVLEKDGDRIAALIAEKRRENEASSFRQKMLQRQIAHQNEKTTKKHSGQTVSPPQLPAPTGISPGKASGSFDSKNFNDSMTASGTTIFSRHEVQSISPERSTSVLTERRSSPIRKHATSFNPAYGWPVDINTRPDSKSSASPTPQKLTTNTSEAFNNFPVYPPPQVQFLSREHAAQLERYNERKQVGPLKKRAATPKTAQDLRIETCRTSSSTLMSGTEAGLSVSGSSAEITAQIVAVTDQLMATGNKPENLSARAGAGGNMSRPESLSKTDMWMAPPSFRTIPDQLVAPTTQTTGSSKPGVDVRSLPILRSSHEQPTLPSQDWRSASHGPQPSAHYVSNTTQHQLTQPLQGTIAAPTYYNINQNFYLGSNQLNSFTDKFTASPHPLHATSHRHEMDMAAAAICTTPQSATRAPSALLHYSPQYAAPTMPTSGQADPRNLPQPPILTSNANMFSGHARAASGNAIKPEMVKKERVNMFMSRNGTGSPFGAAPATIMGMEDVRRQIEMT